MRLNDLQYRILASATLWATAAASALGQSSSSDPSAPLDLLKTARQKAQNSSLNADSIASGGNKAGIVIIVLFAVVGIGLAGVSGVRLYKAAQDDSGREDTGRAIAGLVIGAALTILGVVIGVVTNYMTGSN
ncbi:hypothetical protein [Methylobacterium sp. 22177]|uniref:hypothetical protein n=1 Tax=Methylobacterium sp. 22177 TaxID=3453885 RepID=UPI003F85D21F